MEGLVRRSIEVTSQEGLMGLGTLQVLPANGWLHRPHIQIFPVQNHHLKGCDLKTLASSAWGDCLKYSSFFFFLSRTICLHFFAGLHIDLCAFKLQKWDLCSWIASNLNIKCYTGTTQTKVGQGVLIMLFIFCNINALTSWRLLMLKRLLFPEWPLPGDRIQPHYQRTCLLYANSPIQRPHNPQPLLLGGCSY